MAVNSDDRRGAPSDEEAKRRQAAADQAALDRLYGPRSKEANWQWGIGIALLVLGPILVLAGAAMEGEMGLIAVGVLAFGVGLWAFIDGLVHASKHKREERTRSDQ